MTIKMETTAVFHTLPPIYDQNSSVLILGTMPSPKSREYGFYYSHPQNKFWPVLASLFRLPVPKTPEGKRQFALRHHIALWDVLASCDIRGADDGSIRNPVPNPIQALLEQAPIQAVFTTGLTATKLYQKLCLSQTGVPAARLPSTSPANCRYYTFDALIEEYRAILGFLSL